MLRRTGKERLRKNQVSRKTPSEDDLRDPAQQSATSSFPGPGAGMAMAIPPAQSASEGAPSLAAAPSSAGRSRSASELSLSISKGSKALLDPLGHDRLVMETSDCQQEDSRRGQQGFVKAAGEEVCVCACVSIYTWF